MSENNNSKTKRIAKNTVVLYFRMIFLMIVQLYTTRVVINALGDSDYGIFNVVGGVVIIFSVASRSIGTAISRFLAYGLGEGDESKLQKVFSTSVWMLVSLSIIVLIAMESIGLWFVNCQLTIPIDRITAANWVFQMAILSFVVNLVFSAYNALIVAHEKMSAFAYISIFEALSKLGIAYLIVLASDRLILYSILILFSTFISSLIYYTYCKRHFKESKLLFSIEKDYIRQMFGFTSWSFVGALAHVMRFQGIDIILNMFFGPIVNAAKGIAFSVNVAINGFVVNMMTAVNPQIIKSYAEGDKDYSMKLVFRSARFAFFLFLIISTPIFINAHFILELWLGHIPEHTVYFIRLLIIQTLIDSLINPLDTGVYATGRIKKYSIITGLIVLINIPLSFMLLSLGLQPESVLISSICLTIANLVVRIWLLIPYGLKPISYIKDVLLRIVIVSVFYIFAIFVVSKMQMNDFMYFVLTTLLSIAIAVCTISIFGLTKTERIVVLEKLGCRFS